MGLSLAKGLASDHFRFGRAAAVGVKLYPKAIRLYRGGRFSKRTSFYRNFEHRNLAKAVAQNPA